MIGNLLATCLHDLLLLEVLWREGDHGGCARDRTSQSRIHSVRMKQALGGLVKSDRGAPRKHTG